jgi:(E)-4-hydroxy-3-methylbut-2-enyl-diphosphate synthase|tara:strand:- start:14034 stop:15968 length:1935 start_codon:yes stop_codon:yes gene_type:complete
MNNKKYCNSLTQYSRFKTREVTIGNLKIGGNNPIVIQSMTTTNTMDTKATVAQSIRMIEAGCGLVRITAPGKREAENLRNIKEELVKRGYNTPLVADIHFTPIAAEIAAQIVEKVRVNPGNYADRKKFVHIDYTDAEYDKELARIRVRFLPLVKLCKEHGTAMRIGTNHGSLSDRILSRYGDTPLGMVESAMEFLRICESEGYHNIVLSMKSSNTQVMVEAYRMLVSNMIKSGMNYPLHLGVTEAGEGEDGRIKSAVGIGTLLEDGLGDTVRVSLTEEPEFEIPIAQALVARYSGRMNHDAIQQIDSYPINPFEYKRRITNQVSNIGSESAPIVMADLSLKKEIKPASLFAYGYQYSVPLDKWNMTDQAADYIFVNNHQVDFAIPGNLGIVQTHKTWLENKEKPRHFPFLNISEYLGKMEKSIKLNFIHTYLSDLNEDLISSLKTDKTAVLLLDTFNHHGMAEQRRLFVELMNAECNTPVIIGRTFRNLTVDQLQLQSATDMGALFIDGLGDGVFIASENCGPEQMINQTAFGILQATRTRISKTEYISCPSCGRTLFDLQEVTAKIRARTEHLKGIKIGIMGCIVNGPGEMADADYGYVGTGPGKISLYKEKEVVKRNVSENQAVEDLIALIQEHGDWIDLPN